MRRSLLFSCALHGAIVAIVFATTPRRPPRESTTAVEVALDAAAPPIAAVPIDVDLRAHVGGGGPPRPSAPAVVEAARTRRRATAPARTLASNAPPAPEPAPEPAAAPAVDESPVEVAQAATAAAPPGAPGADAVGDGQGEGAGNGLGDGFGDGFGAGAGGKAMSRELHARVLGNEEVDVRPREGMPTISHDEATALRLRDSFPRLPESVWPQWRPYMVKLEICVAEDGRVREAVLRSSASPRLDPVVLAAAKTWQYRPRLVDGKPAPFCHGVVIKYERW
jgi:TonB family protein